MIRVCCWQVTDDVQQVSDHVKGCEACDPELRVKLSHEWIRERKENQELAASARAQIGLKKS